MLRKGINLNLRRHILPTLYEYLLIIIPVAIYVSLEAMHHGFLYFFKSPEWSIGSIFLSFQAIALYIRNLSKTSKKLNLDFIGIVLIILIIITILASLNAYSSLQSEKDTFTKVLIRIVLLIISTISFFMLVLSSKINE